MAEVDANIPLAAGNIQGLGTQDVMSAFSFASQVQQMRQQQAGQNALKQIFSDPNSVDPKTGLPTAQAIRGVSAVNPELGIKLSDQAMEASVRQAQLRHEATEAGAQRFQFTSSVAGIGYDAYDDAKKAGKSEPDAIAAGQAARNAAVRGNGGVLGDQDADAIVATPFNPAGAKALARANKEWVTSHHDATMEDLAFADRGLAPPGTAPAAGGGTPLTPTAPGTPTSVDDYVGRTTGAESGGDPNAKNPNSTASGLGQFTDGSWLKIMKAEKPDLVKGKTDAQILALRSNGDLSKEMTADYAKQNAPILAADNIPVTTGNLYLAHGFGAQGAADIIKADPTTPIEDVVSGKVMTQNPWLKGKTAGDVVQRFYKKAGNDPVQGLGGDTAPADGGTPAPTATPIIGGKGWTVKTDSDGTQYRYNANRGLASTLDGRPYTPTGKAHEPGQDKFQILHDPNQNVDYRYNPQTKEATTLDGKPFTPTGATHIAGGAAPRSAAAAYIQKFIHDNPNASPDEIAGASARFTREVAENRQVGTRSGAADYAANEANTFAQQARAASAAVPRTDWKAFNQLVQAGQTQTSDPALKKLLVATDALINARARAISPSGQPHLADQIEGRQLLSASDSPEAYAAAVDQMIAEVQGVKAAGATTRDELDARGGAKPAPAATGAKFTPGTVYKDGKNNKARYNADGSWTAVP